MSLFFFLALMLRKMIIVEESPDPRLYFLHRAAVMATD